jgi:hypothetical protein
MGYRELMNEVKSMVAKHGYKMSDLRLDKQKDVKLGREDHHRINRALTEAQGKHLVMRMTGKRLHIWSMAGYKAICGNVSKARAAKKPAAGGCQ